MQQFLVHAPWAHLGHFAQATEHGKFIVSHAHVYFVRLDVRLREGFQLGGRDGGEEGGQDGKVESGPRIGDEGFQVRFGNATDRVDVTARAVVLGQITAEAFIHVCASKDQERAAVATLADGGQKLGEEVGDHHPEAGLDILESQVLGLAAAVDFEARAEVRHEAEEVRQGRYDAIHVQVDMVGSNVSGKCFGSTACVLARIRCAHKAGMEDPITYFLGSFWQPSRRLWLAAYSPDVFDDLFIALLHSLDDQPTHGKHDSCGRTAVDSTAKRDEEPRRTTTSSEVVPQPACGPSRNFFFRLVIADFNLIGRTYARIQIACSLRQPRIQFETLVRRCVCGLQASARRTTEAPHIFQVDCCGNNLHIVEGELRSLSDDPAIDDDHRTTIIVEPVTIAPLLIRVKVYATSLARLSVSLMNTKTAWAKAPNLPRSLQYEIHAGMELP